MSILGPEQPCLMTSQNGGASIYAEELEAAFAISAFVPKRWSMERAKESAFGILWPTASYSEHLGSQALVSNSFTLSSQASRSDESRSSINERGWNMAKFAIGDVVRKTKGGDGVVRAIFTTRDGELTYAVEKEGALDFVDETKLSHQREPELAA